jgi:hypothetical protein
MAQADVSLKSLKIARAIDRLPPGEYNIALVKTTSKGQEWNVQISRVVQHLNIPAQIHETHDHELPEAHGAKL